MTDTQANEQRSLRVALVGLGDAGGHHARALLAQDERVTFAAIAAHSQAGVDRFREQFPIARDLPSFLSLGALLNANVCDAVILATPDALHVEHALMSVAAGVHVLVEKPLALTSSDARQLQEHVARHDRTVNVGYHLRHHAGHVRIKAQLADMIGAPRKVAIEWAWPDPATSGWRARGQLARSWSLAALGTHGIDLALWFLDAVEIERHASLLKMAGDLDTAHEVTFEAGGALVHVAGSITYRARSRVTLIGTEGEITCRGTLGARGDGEIWHKRGRTDPVAVAFDPVHPYTAQLSAFAQAAAKRSRYNLVREITNVTLIEEMFSNAQPT